MINWGFFDTEIQLEVEHSFQPIEGVAYRKVPACTAATLAFQGDYSKFNLIYPYMQKWTRQNGYEYAGNSYIMYYRTPDQEPNPENLVSEVCFPIRKKG